MRFPLWILHHPLPPQAICSDWFLVKISPHCTWFFTLHSRFSSSLKIFVAFHFRYPSVNSLKSELGKLKMQIQFLVLVGNAFRKEIDSKFQQWKQNQLMPKKHAFQTPHSSPSQVLEAHSSWKLPSRLSSFRGGNTESQPQACYHFWFSLLLQSLWCFSIRPEKMKNRKLRWCTTSRAVLIVLGNFWATFGLWSNILRF